MGKVALPHPRSVDQRLLRAIKRMTAIRTRTTTSSSISLPFYQGVRSSKAIRRETVRSGPAHRANTGGILTFNAPIINRALTLSRR